MYEFSSIFVQPFSSSFGSSFLVFPSRRLSVTFYVKTDLKIKHPSRALQKHIQNPVKHPRWKFLRKLLRAFSFKLFSPS